MLTIGSDGGQCDSTAIATAVEMLMDHAPVRVQEAEAADSGANVDHGLAEHSHFGRDAQAGLV